MDALEGGQDPAPYLARHWYNQDPDDLIRLPRLVLAAATGAGLGLCGQ